MQDDLALDQIVDFPTRGDKTLDLVFVSNSSLIERCKPLPGLGDHDAILMDTLISPTRINPGRRKIFLWKRADNQAILTSLEDLKTSLVIDNDINQSWLEFKTHIINTLERHVPSKFSRRRQSQPWINTSVKRMIRRKHKAYTKARSSNSQKDWARYRHLKASSQREARRAHDTYVDEIFCGDINTKPKRFWSYLKGKHQDSSGVAPLKKSDGLLYSDTKSKAEILNTQFHSIYTREDTNNMPNKGTSPYPDMPSIRVSVKGVLTLLKNININKATGPDALPARLLHDYAEHLAPILTSIFQSSLDKGRIPEDWRQASIVPIFK
ncbi:hypothetical protein FSP39_007852 [Pinctada imbricata]|uniref:Endonuclease/exonuclease/phosphatase domain-containing protein n=1 Tax=Pinctada imbricata TaxID=66713 RepID=A0AA88YP83_PINIB|nr:hypothetical protein FSP39_007852 [Pinctada imbricata]